MTNSLQNLKARIAWTRLNKQINISTCGSLNKTRYNMWHEKCTRFWIDRWWVLFALLWELHYPIPWREQHNFDPLPQSLCPSAPTCSPKKPPSFLRLTQAQNYSTLLRTQESSITPPPSYGANWWAYDWLLDPSNFRRGWFLLLFSWRNLYFWTFNAVWISAYTSRYNLSYNNR